MIKVSECPNHRFYMRTNQVMQNSIEKREKRGVPQRGRRWRRRRGRGEQGEAKEGKRRAEWQPRGVERVARRRPRGENGPVVWFKTPPKQSHNKPKIKKRKGKGKKKREREGKAVTTSKTWLGLGGTPECMWYNTNVARG